jgi:ParB-like chromosome segregation protein Spo0J
VVLADPEGNELCLVVDNGGRWRAAARAALDAAPAVEPLPVV